MKLKIFLPIIAIFMMAFAVDMSAQITSAPMTNSGAAVANTATVSLTARLFKPASKISFHLVNTKVSGTVAGKSYLERSNTGANYVAVDSITNTNITTNVKIWEISDPGSAYYRIRNVGTGTMNYTSTCTLTQIAK